MKIKWNWGTKLTIAIILFMSFILALVYLTTKNSIILVEKDYYPQGLKYQQRIEKIKNARKFRDSLKIKIDKRNVKLMISGVKPDSGNVVFYRPDQEKEEDRVFNFDSGKQIKYSYPLKYFRKGIYVLKITWWDEWKGYYLEEKIFINK